MRLAEPSFTVGIEEEYLLVDRDSRDLVADPPASFMRECVELAGDKVSPEFLRSQVEVGTKVCTSIKEARAELAGLREMIGQVAMKYGCAPIAVSTHPFAKWSDQKHTEKDRYNALNREMQAAARRLLICGMHVHVGIEDDELRIDFMNQLSYFLPHMLALTCSSPFWEGEDTGLKCYRLTVFDGLPRTGLPEQFSSFVEYQRHIDVLVQAGMIEDASKIWWDLRPSCRYPTLEMRISDVCTNVDDAVSVAAMNVCLLRMLYRLRRDNQRWRVYARLLINENRWRAMRYGFDEGLIDFAKGEVVDYAVLLEEIISFIDEDARELDCLDEVHHARQIVADGTSAHKQLRLFDQCKGEGGSNKEALIKVVDWLITETAST